MQIVPTLDTAKVVQLCASRGTLPPINSSCTKPYLQPCGLHTFLPISDYPFDHWCQKRHGVKDAVLELAVLGTLERVDELAISLRRVRGDTVIDTISERRGDP